MIFPDSKLAHKYLDGLQGIEIGPAAHNPFHLNTINVDYIDWNHKLASEGYKKEQVDFCGECSRIDLVSPGDELPFKDNSYDFIVSSHVLEHFWDPIKALNEWMRVIKPGGYIFMIVPHMKRTHDQFKHVRTSLQELIDRHNGVIKCNTTMEIRLHNHSSFWITEDVLRLCKYLNMSIVEFQDVDDKAGNGFTIVLTK